MIPFFSRWIYLTFFQFLISIKREIFIVCFCSSLLVIPSESEYCIFVLLNVLLLCSFHFGIDLYYIYIYTHPKTKLYDIVLLRTDCRPMAIYCCLGTLSSHQRRGPSSGVLRVEGDFLFVFQFEIERVLFRCIFIPETLHQMSIPTIFFPKTFLGILFLQFNVILQIISSLILVLF